MRPAFITPLTWATWAYAHVLVAFLWLMSKILPKEKYINLLVTLAQIHTDVGQALMIRAVGFALDNDLEVSLQKSDDKSTDEGSQQHVPEVPKEPLPVFTADDGSVLPLCFDPLPEYPIFEALFTAKFGKFGRCVTTVLGKLYVFTSPELYAFLDKISKDRNAPPALKAFYGSMVSVIVNRYGHKVEPTQLS